MYYTENNHNKVVLRDFYLSRFENGAITEPCGTPEYLGKMFPLNTLVFLSSANMPFQLHHREFGETRPAGTVYLSLPLYSSHIPQEILELEFKKHFYCLFLPLIFFFQTFGSTVCCLAPCVMSARWSVEQCFGLVWPCSLQWKVRTVIHNTEQSN